jgi:formylglycine-generating enzyme required for sulfatase activity
LVAVVVLALIDQGGHEIHGGLKAHALVERLLDANIREVSAVVEDMAPYRPWIDSLLHAAHAQAEKDKDRARLLHTSLALLRVDASQVTYLEDRLLSAEPSEVAVIRDFLAPHRDQLVGALWQVVESPPKGQESQRLRAAAALVKYDRESPKWARACVEVIKDLVRENSVYLLYWSEAFRPVKGSFLGPLGQVFRDPGPERAAERLLAANLLADYAADNPQLLANLLLMADERQFAAILAPFQEHGEKGLALLTGELVKKLPAAMPAADQTREKLAKRQANAAVALLRLGRPEKVWPLLRRNPPDDPRVRSYLIHRLSPLGADARTLIQRLEEEPDVTIRRALFLSLGEFSAEQLPADARASLLPRLKAIYGGDADPGLHAAVEWLLRQWKREDLLKPMNEEWAKNKQERNQRLAAIAARIKKEGEKTPPQWYVNSQSQTMVVIPGPVEFLMGSPATEEEHSPDETQHRRRIGRTYALAAKAVTVRQFRQYLKDTWGGETWFDGNGLAPPLMKKHSPEDDGPIILVDWYHAAAYCNWLSKVEGLPPAQWCYETSLVGNVTALKANYLSLQGYRLPTEAEWEYACRAGAVTSWYYGETEELLPQYGWYIKNSGERTRPVGSKKPNDLGLFDLHGNVYTWCQESYKENNQGTKGIGIIEDKEDDLSIKSDKWRVLRGGAFTSRGSNLRCASRDGLAPADRSIVGGFRPARTFIP